MIVLNIEQKKDKGMSYTYIDEKCTQKELLSHWKHGTRLNTIIVSATGREDGKHFNKHLSVIYRPYDYQIPIGLRNQVPEITLLFKANTDAPGGSVTQVFVKRPRRGICPIDSDISRIYTAILLMDERYFRAGQIIYRTHALHQDEKLKASLLEQLTALA